SVRGGAARRAAPAHGRAGRSLMRIVEGLDQLRPGHRVVALGTFDGVHLGHRRLIETAVREAEAAGVSAAVATFEPMPMEVLRPSPPPPRLPGIGRRAAT